MINNDGWRCQRCGVVNPGYTGSCSCGMTKQENENYGRSENEAAPDKFEQIKKYRELLDQGILTQEEFDKKKKELFDL
ncbi:MAG: SHOCT domain-containing protein [bacterium]|nr:SHOCT domain-containing protein [bacterium]